MMEVEAKVRLGAGGADRLRERLRRLGAHLGGLEVQKDTYFAHPERDLAATDEALRLRSTAFGLELTYKGPKMAGASKTRQEETVRLRDEPTALLAGLGFLEAAKVRKRRERWDLRGVEVAIDQVDGLGEFVEVEVVGTDAAEAGRRVEAALRELGLEGEQRVAASYLEMLQADSEGLGGPGDVLR